MIRLPKQVKEGAKVIGYFAYTSDRQVICDGDACIISGSVERMKFYLDKMSQVFGSSDVIKKTRFSEIIDGMRLGGAYAFDEASYAQFVTHAKKNNIAGLPEKEEVF